MPVIATPVNPSGLLVDDVRRFLRDFPPGFVPGTGVISQFLDGVEFSDDDIHAALGFVTDYYNMMPPPLTPRTPAQMPSLLLMLGVTAHLLRSESLRQLRNQTNSTDGDTGPIGIDDKHPQYLQTAEQLWAQFLDMAKQVKVAENMNGAYGYLASGYRWVSWVPLIR